MMKNALGDVHLGEFTYKSADNTIYKPRNAHTEHAWQAFLNELKNEGLKHLPGSVCVVQENEQAHTEQCVFHLETSEAQLPEYYRRCGCLLCLTWLLRSNDLHEENLIACSDSPVLIDLETLLSGVIERETEQYGLSGSVTNTHLLPGFNGFEDGSGFSGVGGQNLPIVNGKPACIVSYVPQLIEGFEETYRFILLHKECVEKALHLFDHCDFRVILRSTSTYGSILLTVNDLPEHERRKIVNKLLRRAYEKDIDPERINKASLILEAETYALTQNWIPLFYSHGDSTTLFCDGRQLGLERGEQIVMDGFFRLSPVDAAKAKIRRMDETELKKQTAIIRTVYHSKETLPEATEHTDWNATLMCALEREQIPNLPGSYMHLSGSNGKGIWISGGFTLYEGAAGILCALAAMGQEEESLFQKLYQDLEAYVLRTPMQLRLNGDACGLGSGVSGIIAGLIHISELTGKKKYSDEANALLSCFEETAAPGTETDVLGGLAGLCLQLPKLKGEKAKRLASALMPEMLKANTRLTGAGHGKAGLALALGALQYTLGTDEADERILQLLREEDAICVRERNNWPDLREEGKISFMGGWCSGAPGIGMYRKKLMEYTDNLEILEICGRDVAIAKAYLEEHVSKPLQRDTLCCGNAARLTAASYLGVDMPELKKTITRSVDPASPRLFHLVNTADHQVSLMQGAAGVGYALALYGDDKSGGMLR